MPSGTDRPLTLLTDYGVGGEHVGALHLALAAACPDAPRVDIAHDIPPGDIRWGALTLSRHAPALPSAVHLAVVDPGVGGPRRALAISLEDDGYVVGPDNGLLGPIADVVGVRTAVELRAMPADAPRTFHGRDLFAPAAAHLSTGGLLAELGVEVDPAGIVHPRIDPPKVAPGLLSAEVAGRDRFGNISLLARRADLVRAELASRPLRLVGSDGRAVDVIAGTRFGDVAPGELVLYEDSNRVLSVAQRGGDAWAVLGCASGSRLTVTARRS